MDNAKISVIIPAYNAEQYIEQTIKSVLNQTYKNIEIIIVDDGSTDDTLSVIKNIEDQNSQKIKAIHTDNQGVTSARLTGIENSTGEWIGFVDSDDEIEQDMYELLMSNAIRYKADISHCGYQMIFPNGRINYFYNTGRLVEQDRTTGVKDLLEGSFIEPGLWNKLFHKTLFHSLLHEDVMDKNIKINEDLLMNFYLFQNSKKSIYVDKCEYKYFVREGSVSRKKLNQNKIYDPIKVKEIIIKHSNTNEKVSAERAYVRTCVNTYNTLIIQKDSLYRNDERTVRQMIIKNKGFRKLMNKKNRISILFIIYMPFIYKLLYCFYEKYFQVKLYK